MKFEANVVLKRRQAIVKRLRIVMSLLTFLIIPKLWLHSKESQTPKKVVLLFIHNFSARATSLENQNWKETNIVPPVFSNYFMFHSCVDHSVIKCSQSGCTPKRNNSWYIFCHLHIVMYKFFLLSESFS